MDAQATKVLNKLPGREDVAVQFDNVSKAYRLYSTPQARLLCQMGLGFTLPKTKREYKLFHALHNASFTLKHGERIGLVGRNGAGKTTLLKLITDNFEPTSGSITINGTVQALMQLGLGFHPEFSGLENIKSALSYNGLTGDVLKEAVEDVVDFVELGPFLHQPLKTYSLGMNARLQFAAATAIRPDILLIDEILSAGDSYFSAKSAFRMEKLANSGCTVILVSHSWQQIQQYCKRALWLREGRVFMDGATHEVMAAYEVHIAEETAKKRNFSAIDLSQQFSAPSGLLAPEANAGERTDGVETAPASPQHAPPPVDPAYAAVIAEAVAALDTETFDPDAEQQTSETTEAEETEDFAQTEDAANTASQAEDGAAEVASDEPPPAVSEGPDYAQVPWLVERIREHEGVVDTEEFQDRMRDGHRVFRMPGIPGLRFHYVAVTQKGERVLTTETGKPLEIRFEIRADRTDQFICTYWIHFFGLDGRRVARIESPPDKFHLKKGQVRGVSIDLNPLLLGGGDYLISFSAFDLADSGSAADTLNTRYEMLARSYQLKVVVPTDSDPPNIHYPGIWTFGGRGPSKKSVVRGA